MFNSNYYKNRFIRTNDKGIHTLYETYYSFPDGLEMFRFEISSESDEYEIYLVHKSNQLLKEGEKDTSLSDFLGEYGYTKKEFANPFNRTKKILMELKKINEQTISNPSKTKKK